MIYINTYAIIFCAFWCHSQIFGQTFEQDTIDGGTVDQTPLAATCSAETVVKVFAAIVAIDLISAHDPKIVFELMIPSDVAAGNIYNTKSRILQDKGFTKSDEFASISANAVLLNNQFSLWSYYQNGAISVGEFLAERGLLSCSNVIQTATKFFENEQKAFKTLDSSELVSYLAAVYIAVEDSLEDLGYTSQENEDNWQIIYNHVYRNFN